MLMFCGLSALKTYCEYTRQEDIYKCLLSSDWLGVLIRRSKYSKYMSRNALGEAALKVVGANLNSSLLLLRISQMRISILFIYLLHLLNVFST